MHEAGKFLTGAGSGVVKKKIYGAGAVTLAVHGILLFQFTRTVGNNVRYLPTYGRVQSRGTGIKYRYLPALQFLF